jgi:sulfur carrier protein
LDNTSVGKRTLQTSKAVYPNFFKIGDFVLDIRLNNKPYQLKENSSLQDLIKTLKLNPDSIVTEVNLNIIKKDKREETMLKDGDKVEIITFMGGG